MDRLEVAPPRTLRFVNQALRVRRDCERATGGTSGSMNQPTAEHALRHLEPLVGEWTFEAKWPSGEPWRGRRKGHLRVARLGGTPAPACDGGASRGARQRLHHWMRCGQRDVLPAVLPRARRLPHLRDEHRRRRVETLAGGRAVFPALHSDLHGRREHDHGTLGDRRRRHQLHDRLDLIFRRVDTERRQRGLAQEVEPVVETRRRCGSARTR